MVKSQAAPTDPCSTMPFSSIPSLSVPPDTDQVPVPSINRTRFPSVSAWMTRSDALVGTTTDHELLHDDGPDNVTLDRRRASSPSPGAPDSQTVSPAAIASRNAASVFGPMGPSSGSGLEGFDGRCGLRVWVSEAPSWLVRRHGGTR